MKEVFKGKKFKVFSGRYDLVDHPGAVVILPLIDKNHLLMIKNERPCVNKTLWELPAGTLEEGESPETTAARELIEETGYQAKELKPMTEFYTTPGFCNEKMYAFTATELKHVGQDLDDGENIEVIPLHWNDAKQMIANHQIEDAKTLAALLYYLSTPDSALCDSVF